MGKAQSSRFGPHLLLHRARKQDALLFAQIIPVASSHHKSYVADAFECMRRREQGAGSGAARATIHFGRQAVGEQPADTRRDVPAARRLVRRAGGTGRCEGVGAPLRESLENRDVYDTVRWKGRHEVEDGRARGEGGGGGACL
jgi:hypothetical protein